jgi:hypothetical protein
MATTTNYGWTTPDDTALVKDGASAIRTLGSSVDTTVKALNPETTLGDISYRSSTANTNTRLAIGTTGQVLTVSGGVPSWATPAGGSTFVGCRAFRNSAQTINNASLTAIEYNAETYDTDNFHDTSTNPSRMTIPTGKGGYYVLHVMLTYSENSGGFRDLRFYKNGSELQMLRTAGQPNANALTGMFASYAGNFAAGDYLEVFGYQNSGGSLDIGANTNSFTLYKVGD